MADWTLEGVAPWLKTAQQESANLDNRVLAAMQFGAQQQQNQFNNALRVKQFAAEQTTRELQNRGLAQRLDDDASDTKTLQEFLPRLKAANTPDDMANLDIPAMKNVLNTERLSGIIADKSRRLASTSGWHLYSDFWNDYAKLDNTGKADLNAYGLPQSPGDVDPDMLELIGSHQTRMLDEAEQRKEKAALATQNAIQIRQLAVQSLKNEAILARQQGVTEDLYVQRHLNQMLKQGLSAPDADAILRATWQGALVGNPEAQAPAKAVQPNFKDREDVKDVDLEIKSAQKKLDELTPQGVPSETRYFWNAHNPDFDKYKAATNTLAELHAKKAALLEKFRPVAPVTAPSASVTTKAQFDALPSGAVYVGEDGRKYQKP